VLDSYQLTEMEGVLEYFASSVGIIFRSPSQMFSDFAL